MQTAPLILGIILVILGLLGMAYNYEATWMWILVVLGVIGVIWGLMPKMKQM